MKRELSTNTSINVEGSSNVSVEGVGNIYFQNGDSSVDELVAALDQLRKAIETNPAIPGDLKQSQIGVIDELNKEVQKPSPNSGLTKTLGNVLTTTLKSFPDLADILKKLAPLIVA